MDAALAALFLVPGLALGSFLNVVAARVPLHRSIVRPRSTCPRCGTEIVWYDNIPLLSYALLRGRCRSCHRSISPRYPLVELATALLVAGCVWKFGVTADAAVATVFCAVLVAASTTDVEHGVVPNAIVLPTVVVVLAAQSLLHPGVEWMIAALGSFAVLLAVVFMVPEGMGMGDLKLALLVGAMLGRVTPLAFLVALAAALVVALVLLLRRGSTARSVRVPFARFLWFGAIVALFAGPELLDRYRAL